MTDLFDTLRHTTLARLLPRAYLRRNAYTFKLDQPSDFAGIDPLDSAAMIERTQQLLQQHQALWAIGRYAEQRSLYQHPQYTGEDVVHLGLDFTLPVGTPIYAPLPARVQRCCNYAQAGDFGPTLLLQHNVGEHRFYSLYGHLSRNDLQQHTAGQQINAGDCIGHIGDTHDNGGWPPHLHLQLIRELDDHSETVAGVCAISDKQAYLRNNPNPSCLVRLDDCQPGTL